MKSMSRRTAAIIGVILVAALLNGCATLKNFNSSPAAPLTFAVISNAAVGVAVGKGVNPQTIANIASQLQKFDAGTTVTIPLLQAELNKLMGQANFNVAEQVAANQLVLAFSAIIQAQVKNGNIDAVTQATIQQIFQDVIAAAELFGATPPTALTQPLSHPSFSVAFQSPTVIGGAASTVLVAGIQAFGHQSVDARVAAALTVLFTAGAALVQTQIGT